MSRAQRLADGEVVLASVPVGEGQEAWIVRTAAGAVRVSPGAGRFTHREGDPAFGWVPAGTLVYGWMPPGATVVEVVGGPRPSSVVYAGGMFLAVVRERLGGPVRALFRGPDGAIVPHPVEGAVRREAVEDADEPCPACGHREWDAVEMRAAPENTYTRWRRVACRTCGRPEGGWREAGRRRPNRPDSLADYERRHPAGLSVWSTLDQVIAAAPFVVYALDAPRAGRPRIGGWGHNGRELKSVAVRQRWRRVEWTVSSARPRSAWTESAVEAFTRLLEVQVLEEMPGNVSSDAWEVRSGRAHDIAAERARSAHIGARSLPVDGRRVAFTTVEGRGLWLAQAKIDRVAVEVRAEVPDGVPPGLSLTALSK